MTSLVNLKPLKRYFVNPCELNPTSLAQYASEKWLEDWIRELADRLTKRQLKKDELEDSKSVYRIVCIVNIVNDLVFINFSDTMTSFLDCFW